MEIEVKNYVSVTGNPLSYLLIDGVETAIKSYDKLVKILDPLLYKKFLLVYPNEEKAI